MEALREGSLTNVQHKVVVRCMVKCTWKDERGETEIEREKRERKARKGEMEEEEIGRLYLFPSHPHLILYFSLALSQPFHHHMESFS